VRDFNKFPTTQLFILALIRVSEPIALTSIFPYAWKLVLHYNIGDKGDASFHAGILISAFALAEALTGMYWGGLSDRIGRKPVLLLGCAGTMLSLLLVGIAPNFWVALFGRALGGLLNGNIGVIQTMVGEITINPKHEPRAFSVMPFVWSIGTIIGPSIGGYFANPADNFPEVFSKNGIFAKFPYLLPNLICAVMMLGSIAAGYFLLEETHPDMQPWSTPADLANTEAETPHIPAQAGTTTAAANLAQEGSYGTFNRVKMDQEQDWAVGPDGEPYSDPSDPPQTETKVFTRQVIMLVVALGIFTYHSMTYDHLLPIFFQDDRKDDVSTPLAGGLGLSIQQVGVIMSVNGVIALFVQGVIFPAMAAWLGVWKIFILVTVLHPIAYFIVPYLAVLPEDLLYPGIYACLTVRNFFAILAYPVMLILLKEASPSPTYLGKINGLAASTGAACRTLASPIAGLLYGVGIDINFTALAWWASGLVAIIGSFQCFYIRQRKGGELHHVTSRAVCRFVPNEHTNLNRNIVRVRVESISFSPEEAADERRPLLHV